MSDDKKPRICETLGVEVNERFSLPDMSGEKLRISSSGYLCGGDCGIVGGRYVKFICEAINHPESIQHAPRWTLEDIADAEAVRQLWPYAVSAERDKLNGCLYIIDAEDTFIVELDQEIFPELQPGEIVTLGEIMEAEDG